MNTHPKISTDLFWIFKKKDVYRIPVEIEYPPLVSPGILSNIVSNM